MKKPHRLSAKWRQIQLGECCEIVSGATPSRDVPEYWGGSIDWVTPKDLSKLEGAVLQEAPEKITEAGYRSCSTSVMPKGAVLFSSRAPIGLVAIAGRPMCTNQGFKNVVPGSNVVSEYLYWCLRWLAPEIAKQGTGTTFKEIAKPIMEEVEIPLPPLDEQRRIAAMLDKADSIRRKRQESIRLTAEFLRSVFLDMFGDPVMNPKMFPIAKMGDVCDVRDGTHDSPRYISEGGYPLVTSKNLTGGILDLADVNFISEADYIQINKRSKVDQGDIIMPMIGTIGSPVLMDHEPNYAIKNVALIKFRKESPSAVFVHHLLSCHYFDYIVELKSRGGTQQFISLGDLRAFPLLMPPPELQREFVSRNSIIEKCKNTQRVALEEVGNLFNGLIQRAFRGELL